MRRRKRGEWMKKQYRERKKAAAQLRPWRVNIYYNGFHPAYDRMLFKVVGKYSDGSGMMMTSGERDHEWAFKTETEAREVADRLVRLPGITKVEIFGNLTEALEVEIANRPMPGTNAYRAWRKARHARRRRQRAK